LSERLRAQERDFIAALTDELKNLKLNIDVEDVRQLNLNSRDLYQFKELLDYGEFVRKRLHNIFEYELFQGTEKSDLPIIESRVKSPQSFIKKMLSRKLVDFSQVDDSVGFRIVCMSKQDAENISNDVITNFYRVFPEAIENGNGIKQVANINEVSSQVGYKARHIYLSVPINNKQRGGLGCEIQVRTAFQDAWARVSHEISYKKTKKNITKKALKELSELCEKSDNIIDKLSLSNKNAQKKN